MSSLGLTPLVEAGFQLSPRVDGPNLLVSFSGNGDMTAVEALGRYLKEVHTEAITLNVEEVRFDLHDLTFMNSSCFKAFVTWIDVVSRIENGYKIRFLTNHRHAWQRRSLEALRCLSPNVVRVEAQAS